MRPAAEPVLDLCTRMGLAERRASSISRRPSLIPSRYMQTTWVSGSSMRYSRRSFSSTSSLLPIETTLATPSPSLVQGVEDAQHHPAALAQHRDAPDGHAGVEHAEGGGQAEAAG